MADNHPIIRPASDDDAAGVAEIYRLLDWFEFTRRQTAQALEAMLQHYLIHCHRTGATVLVAEMPGSGIAGVAVVNWHPTIPGGWEGYVSQLFVHPDWRGQGIGGRLVEAVVEEGRRRECSRLMLYISRERDAYQRGFYMKAGWHERADAAMFVMKL